MAGADVSVADGIGVAGGLGEGEAVGMNCVVAVGHGERVKVGEAVSDAVELGKSSVEPGFGVLVGTLGTHKSCPE